MAHCSVLGWISPDLTGPDRPRDRLGPTSGGSIGYRGYGGSCVPLDPLRSSTCNTLAHGSMLWDNVVYLASPHLTSSGPHRPGDRLGPTYGGTIGYRGMVDPVPGFASCTVLDCRMPSTGLHVGTVVGGV